MENDQKAGSTSSAASDSVASQGGASTPLSSAPGYPAGSVAGVKPDQASATSADLPPSSASVDPSMSVADRKAAALKLKEEGNKLFVAADYEQAKQRYGEAIALDPSVPALWSNRAACELKLEQHGLAIEDATKAITLDSKFAKAYYRRATAHLSILDPKAAAPDLKAVLVLEPNNRTVRAQLDATSKLIRRLEFEKAIKVEEGRKAWMAAVEHLENGTGGTSVRADYTGPRLPDGEGAEAHLGSINQEFIDGMIEHYKSGGHLPLKYAWQIILGAHRAFMNEPSLVDFEVQKEQTVDVVGDTHGQFFDFVHLLSLTGNPSESHSVLFNGDFVDRGSWSVEIALTIFAFKWLYPRTTLVNRGNHETADMNKVYGFEGECKHKYGGDLTFKIFTEVFVSLPIATLITAPLPPLQGGDLPATVSKAQKSPVLSPDGKKRFFVVHGGLFSKDDVKLEDIKAIDRQRLGQPGTDGLMMECLWSDPQVAKGRGPSKRGVGLGFGPDVTRAWCELNGVTAVLRSHEVRQGGYAEEHDGMCCTVFSAPNYCDEVGNLGAFARIDAQGTIEWTTFKSQPHPNIKPMAYANGPGGFGGMLGR